MNEIQKAILTVAEEVRDICAENGIRCFIIGGTFLGAVRHKGFIPWDDDVDLGMSYRDYCRFVELASGLDHPWLSFDIPSMGNRNYSKLFIKAYDSRTTLLEEQRDERDARGVFVDIFPIGYAADTPEASRSLFMRYQLIRALLDRKRYRLYEKTNLKDMLLKAASLFVPERFLVRKGLAFIEAANAARKEYSMTYDGYISEIIPTSYLEDSLVSYPFEGTEFHGFKDYDGYLRTVFGDYMTPPPPEKRVPVHIKFCDLGLPYREFLSSKGYKLP